MTGKIWKVAIVKMTSEASPRTYAPAHSGVGLMMYQVGYAQSTCHLAAQFMVRATVASDVAKAQDGSNKVIRVKGCMKGSSAEESGNVFAGDTVISVNGCSTREMSIDQVRNMIVGPEGDIVAIGYF